MEKVYGYIRVSTAKQGKGVSLVEQKDAIDAYAKRHNLTIGKWFEEVETAAQKGRPVFSEMIKLLKKGKSNGVIMHKIDRSARNMRDWSELTELADNDGVQVHFVQESVNLLRDNDRLSADMQAVVASHYVRNLRKETIKGLYGRLKQGVYPFQAPIGYLDTGAGNPK
ncbi:recombinase family protein, partial [Candidatus Pacearchaeota archaeon]|nr:recombinase family protein [Candidatus Pacearchaeota archaeon]